MAKRNAATGVDPDAAVIRTSMTKGVRHPRGSFGELPRRERSLHVEEPGDSAHQLTPDKRAA